LHEKNPELILLHVGTNDIHQKEPEEIVNEMESLCTGIVTNSLAKVAISEIIQREDESLNIKIKT
jgi:lysophospholipase L1-like esterase